jgi:hypothetical protein
VHVPCREACPAAMATSPSTALSARDASNRRERSSTVRCATEPKIGDAPGKPITMSNLMLWAPAHTAAGLAGSSSHSACRPSRSRTAVLCCRRVPILTSDHTCRGVRTVALDERHEGRWPSK